MGAEARKRPKALFPPWAFAYDEPWEGAVKEAGAKGRDHGLEQSQERAYTMLTGLSA